VPGHGAGVLPLELVPVPRQGAQICARAPSKGYAQTSARAGTKSERGQRERSKKGSLRADVSYFLATPGHGHKWTKCPAVGNFKRNST